MNQATQCDTLLIGDQYREQGSDEQKISFSDVVLEIYGSDHHFTFLVSTLSQTCV